MNLDLKLTLFVVLSSAYFGGYMKVKCDVDLENAPWGPEYEHEIEMEFTPMDPRDFPESRNPELYDEDVMILASGSFEREIKRSYMIFIFFYKEKCEKCKKARPEFGKAATTIGKEITATPIIFASINCGNEGRKVCNKYDIKHLPTLKLFKEGQFVKNYAGPATEMAFANFVRKEMNPGPRKLVTLEEFHTFTNNDDTQVVGFFGLFPTDLKEAYRLSVDRLGSAVSFGMVDDSELIKQFRKYEDRVVLFRPNFLASPHEDQIVVYDGPGLRLNVSSWIMNNYHGIMGLRYEHNQHQFSAPCIHIYYNHDFDINNKTSHYWRNRLMEQAKHYKDKLKFSLSRVTDYKHELEHFGLIDEDTIYDPDSPMVAGWDKFGQKFVMRDTFTVDGFKSWLQHFVDGELMPFLRSEEPPVDKIEDGVQIVVASTWITDIVNEDKDALITFHAPWCSHCKMLMPVLKKLAVSLKLEEVNIVKFDAVSNDIPKYFSVDGFPTIYFLQKNDKTQPILFNAPRKHSNLLRFVAEKATNPLKNYDRKGISQSYLQQEGAPTYDKEERLKKNLKDGFQNQRYGLLKDEL